jgi:hypothetical protein
MRVHYGRGEQYKTDDGDMYVHRFSSPGLQVPGCAYPEQRVMLPVRLSA